jgi:hypothetical protein
MPPVRPVPATRNAADSGQPPGKSSETFRRFGRLTRQIYEVMMSSSVFRRPYYVDLCQSADSAPLSAGKQERAYGCSWRPIGWAKRLPRCTKRTVIDRPLPGTYLMAPQSNSDTAGTLPRNSIRPAAATALLTVSAVGGIKAATAMTGAHLCRRSTDSTQVLVEHASPFRVAIDVRRSANTLG